MAVTTDDLDQLCDDGFGPVTFRRARGRGSYHAAYGDDEATVTHGGAAIELTSTAGATWPREPRVADDVVADRVAAALDEVALSRPELTEVTATPGRGDVTVSLWLDGETTTRGEVAAAVRTVVLLARAGGAVLTRVQEELRIEQDLVALAQETTALMDAPPPVPEAPAAVAPPRPAASAPPPAATAPPAATVQAGSWAYVTEATALLAGPGSGSATGQAVPGTWYAVQNVSGGWAEVTDGTGQTHGWLPAAALHPRT